MAKCFLPDRQPMEDLCFANIAKRKEMVTLLRDALAASHQCKMASRTDTSVTNICKSVEFITDEKVSIQELIRILMASPSAAVLSVECSQKSVEAEY